MSLQDLAYNYNPDDQPSRQPPPVSSGPTPEESAREQWPPFSETGRGTTVGGQPAGAGLPPRQDPYIPPGPPTFPQSRDPSSWLGALANFWNALNTKPAGDSPGEAIRNFLTGQQPQFTNEPFATGEGVQYPPAAAPAGAPGGPSPMEARPQPQFPPSPLAGTPETTGAKETPPSPPPEAKRAPPRQEPYIPSRRDVPMGDLGKPDLVEQGAARYPGLIPGPYMPQPHEFMPVMRRSYGFLGQVGSGRVMGFAHSLAALDPAYWKARQAGEAHKSRMISAEIAQNAKLMAQHQAAESREFAEAFAAYGPHDGKPGDEEMLRSEITRIAAQNNDDNVIRAMNRGGLPAVERLIRARDASGKDASKTLIQIQRQNAIRLQEERLRKYEEERARRRAQDDAWMVGGMVGAGGTPTGGMAPVGNRVGITTVGPGELEFDPHFGGTPEKTTPEKDEGPTPEEKVEPDEPDTSQKSDDDQDQDQSKAEPDEDKDKKAAAAEPESPSDRMISAAQGAMPSAAEPTRTAALDTGTKTDAAPTELPRQQERLRPPVPTADAPAGAQTAAAGAPAPGTPEAMGATQPVPSLRPQPPTPRGTVPTEATVPGTREQPLSTRGIENVAEPVYEWQRPPSAALGAVTRSRSVRMPDGSVKSPNLQAIDVLAQQMINGTKKREDLKSYPEWVVQAARQRGDEIAREMHDIAADPNIKTADQVYAALRKINPEFADTLKAHVEGRKSVPNSAWANPGYSARLVQLGSKADPNFNENNAKTRAATLKDAATGKIAQGLTFTATAYRHLHHVEELLKQRPANWATRVLANFDTPGWVDKWLAIHPEDRDIMGALENAVNTANSEYERALVGGRPTVTGRKVQAAEIPLVLGNTRTMLANIRDKQIMLRDRLDELEQQFNAGTGMQPTAMYERFRAAQGLANRQRDADDLRALQAGGSSAAPAATGGGGESGVVDFRKYFGIR